MSLFGDKKWGLEMHANDAIKKIETDHAALSIVSQSHVHTGVFMCYWWYSLPLPRGIAGKVSLPGSTRYNLAERVALRCCLTSRDTEFAVSTLVSLFWRSYLEDLLGIRWEST